ncbi:MAG: hypothetical protein NZL99_06195, partial [Burkholderiaceae bacterium]|nr:hypothetical protein [Burkholderiaceae bacterium]
MKTALLYTLLAAALALATVAAHAKGSRGAGKADYRGYPGARAIDGDTFRYRGERYRLRQYDAPELGSP